VGSNACYSFGAPLADPCLSQKTANSRFSVRRILRDASRFPDRFKVHFLHLAAIQIEVPADSDKALSDQETTTFGGLKAGYR